MISLFKKKEAPVYPADTVTSRDGRPIVFTFFKHASLAVDFDGRHEDGQRGGGSDNGAERVQGAHFFLGEPAFFAARRVEGGDARDGGFARKVSMLKGRAPSG